MVRKLLCASTLILVFSLCFSMTAHSSQKQFLETEGNVGFTGTYTPIGSPDPTPHENEDKPPTTGIAKPEGTLPQTNDIDSSWLPYVGIFIISFVFFFWKKSSQQKTLKH